MREIKFRAWDKVNKEWANLVLGAGGQFICMRHESGDYEDWQQYTGLKDKNGKEVYEGDILQFSDKWEWYRHQYGFSKTREEIEALPYGRGAITWNERDGSWEHIGGTSDLNSYLEIIGNIYENPELLPNITSDKTDV